MSTFLQLWEGRQSAWRGCCTQQPSNDPPPATCSQPLCQFSKFNWSKHFLIGPRAEPEQAVPVCNNNWSLEVELLQFRHSACLPDSQSTFSRIDRSFLKKHVSPRSREGAGRIPAVKLEIPWKSIFEIRNQNFCYIPLIVFDLSYLPVAAVGTAIFWYF